jgi:hypothetical protein
MPTIAEFKGIKIVLWTNDHNPAHVHVVVRAEGIEFRVYLKDFDVEYITSNQLNRRDEKLVIKFIKQNETLIWEMWNEIKKDQ